MNKYDTPIIILLYHRVADLETDPQMLAVSVSNFEKHVKFLKENYQILRFEESWGKIRQPSVIITFDDGYLDNYKYAMPVLEKYKVPATIFVATGNIDNKKEFWWDNIERIILLNNNLPDTYVLQTDGKKYNLVFKNRNDMYDSYYKLHSILKNMQADERIATIEKLENELNPTIAYRNLYRTMNSLELCNIDKSEYITIGGHTVTHTQLSLQAKDVKEKEIRNSKDVLEKLLQHEITTFSYPFGCKEDYDDDTIRILHDIGYKKAASNYSGIIHSWHKSRFEYPRYLVRNWNIVDFQKNINKYFYFD